MNLGIVAAIAYGVLALVGGVMGYAKVKSKASLISGSISGVLLLVAGLMQLQGFSMGLILALVVTAALVVVFAIRLVKTRKFMPAGLMLVAGVVTFGIEFSSLLA
ncbi:MAG: TMEM14 family protein [Xenococcaceae cyanobacterium]